MAGSRSRAKGTLEAEVLACLAAAGGGLTPAEVQADLGSGLAYTTIMTTLARLHAKGALERAADGRAYRYYLRGGAEGARSNMAAHQMLKLLDDESDRAGVLTRFVAELSVADERVLARLVGSAPEGKTKPGARSRKRRQPG